MKWKEENEQINMQDTRPRRRLTEENERFIVQFQSRVRTGGEGRGKRNMPMNES